MLFSRAPTFVADQTRDWMRLGTREVCVPRDGRDRLKRYVFPTDRNQRPRTFLWS